jgi:hypothetical protein
MKKILISFILITTLSSCSTSGNGGCDMTGWCEGPDDYYQEEPYLGYSDGYDQDCSDIGQEVPVPYDDPDGLDADGDGWGCESYGG